MQQAAAILFLVAVLTSNPEQPPMADSAIAVAEANGLLLSVTHLICIAARRAAFQ